MKGHLGGIIIERREGRQRNHTSDRQKGEQTKIVYLLQRKSQIQGFASKQKIIITIDV